jgi:hypothetical protein
VSDDFDPYREWLGVVDPQRPPGLYVLLGLPMFEADRDRIEQALLRRTFAVSNHLDGPQRDWAEKLLDQLTHAEEWLTDSSRKAQYDAFLRESLVPPSHEDCNRSGSPVAEDDNDAPVMLIEVQTASEPVMLLEVAETTAPDLPVAEAPSPAAPAEYPVKPRKASLDISAAAIAERILRDEVKPEYVPQRASEVKKPQPQTSKSPPAPKSGDHARTAAPPEPPRPLERFDSLKPLPKAPPPPPSIKLSADGQTIVSQPLISRVDLIAVTSRHHPQQENRPVGENLSQIDTSVMLEAGSRWLSRCGQLVSRGKVIAVAAVVAIVTMAVKYGPELLALIPVSADAVAARIDDPDPRTRIRGVAQVALLPQTPEERSQLLIRILKDDPANEVRRAALDALINSGTPSAEVTDAVKSLLESEQDADIRRMLEWLVQPPANR